MSHQRLLGEILLENGFITAAQLEEAVRLRPGETRRIGQILLDMGAISQDQLNWALSQGMGIPYVELGDEVVDFELARAMPEEVLRRHEAVPVLRVGDEMTVIVADPTNRQAAVELEAMTGVRVTTAMASRASILHLLDKAFPPGQGPPGRVRYAEVGAVAVSAETDLTGVAQVYALLLGALREDATEIHVEPLPEEVLVRNRIDRRLVERARLPRSLHGPVTFRLRVLAGLRGEKSPCQAQVRTRLEGRDIELDLLFFPTLHGEAVTVRVWPRDPDPPTLHALGLPPPVRETLASLLTTQGGLIFVTGWEARARATLLYALARAAASPARKTVTIERSASFVVPEFLQVEISGDFAAAAATILAHPSDVALVEDLAPSQVCLAAFASAEQGTLVMGGLGFATNASGLAHLLALDAPRGALLAVTRGLVHVRRRGLRHEVEVRPMTEELRQELVSGQNGQ